jgi:pilus assembly protein CpaF
MARRQGSDEEGWSHLHLATQQYGPLGAIRNQPKYKDALTEISINGPHKVAVRVAGKGYVELPPNEAQWATVRWFEDLCSYFAAAHGVNWSRELPLIACRTPDSDRFMGIVGPNVESRFACSIRVKRMKTVEYENFGIDRAAADMITQYMVDGRNIALSGGTGSGKTTLFNRMCRDIPPHHRVITAEDTRELIIPVWNRVHFIVSRTEAHTRIRYNEITDTVLRLNPDRYLFGELSIQNAFALVQALDTGHDGAGTTGHANSAFDFMRGMRRRVALGGGNVSAEINDMLDFIADTIHLIIQVKHMPTTTDTERRLMTEMAKPKELLSARKRENLVDRMQHDDRVVDLRRARDALLAANAGAPLDPAQKSVLQTLAVLGFLKPGHSKPVAEQDVGSDAKFLSPEDQFYSAAASQGRLMDANAVLDGFSADGHGDMAHLTKSA